MIKYAKIADENTHSVIYGMGNNEKLYRAMGLELMDIELSPVDGLYYEMGHAPQVTQVTEE